VQETLRSCRASELNFDDRIDGKTLMQLLASKKQWYLIRDIIRRGAKPVQEDSYNVMWDLVRCPESRHTLATLELILEGGLNRSLAGSHKLALAAAKRKNWRMVHMLAEAGTDLHMLNASGESVLLLAAECVANDCRQDIQELAAKVCEELVSLGAATEVMDSSGCTPLMLLARAGRWGLVRALARKGAEIEINSCTVTVDAQRGGDRKFHVDWECVADTTHQPSLFHCASALSATSMATLLKDFQQFVASDRYLCEGERTGLNGEGATAGSKAYAPSTQVTREEIALLATRARTGRALLKIRSVRPFRISGKALFIANATASVGNSTSDVSRGVRTLPQVAVDVAKDVTPLGLIEELCAWLGWAPSQPEPAHPPEPPSHPAALRAAEEEAPNNGTGLAEDG